MSTAICGFSLPGNREPSITAYAGDTSVFVRDEGGPSTSLFIFDVYATLFEPDFAFPSVCLAVREVYVFSECIFTTEA